MDDSELGQPMSVPIPTTIPGAKPKEVYSKGSGRHAGIIIGAIIAVVIIIGAIFYLTQHSTGITTTISTISSTIPTTIQAGSTTVPSGSTTASQNNYGNPYIVQTTAQQYFGPSQTSTQYYNLTEYNSATQLSAYDYVYGIYGQTPTAQAIAGNTSAAWVVRYDAYVTANRTFTYTAIMDEWVYYTNNTSEFYSTFSNQSFTGITSYKATRASSSGMTYSDGIFTNSQYGDSEQYLFGYKGNYFVVLQTLNTTASPSQIASIASAQIP